MALTIVLIFYALFPILSILGIAGICWLAYIAITSYQKRVQSINAYAVSRGWTALASGDQTLGGYVPHRLFNKGDRHTYGLAYQVMVNQRQGVLFEYSTWSDYQDSQGNSQSSSTPYMVLAFELAGITDLEVISKGLLGNLTSLFSHETELTLEGDFNKYFRVVVQPNQQVDALTILTPDTMQFIEDFGKTYSIQVQGGWVVIYAAHSNFSQDRMAAMMSYAERLQAELAQKLH